MVLFSISRRYSCYIIKKCFFYFNHLSLIIFYHLVWLDLELFGLRVQVCRQLVQFTLAHKGDDNHHCYNKPLHRKWDWSVDDVMPGREGLRIWKILKKIQLSSDHGVEKLGSDPDVEKASSHGVEKLRLDHEMCRTLGVLLAKYDTRDF